MTLPSGAHDATRVGGGDINEAFHLTLADGREAFVKTRPDAAPGEYALEAAALRWLGEANALPVPEVLELDEGYLALQWVAPGRLSAEGAERLGRGLARLHEAGAERFGDPGFAAQLGIEARIGSLRLPNDPCPDWPSFYAQRRLEPLAQIALRQGAISTADAAQIEAVCERIGELAGPPEPPARLHGDLWSGNVHADEQGMPWLIDPSAYGGHREVDLAMLRLFGAPSERVFDAYEEVFPLADGWRERVALWQLSPLLVHAALFGGSYRMAVQRTLGVILG